MSAKTPQPHAARIQELLVAGQDAAEADQWVAAALSWVEASKLGSLDGANAVSRVAAPRIRLLADGGDVDAQAVMAGILVDFYTADALPMAVGYAKAAADAGHPAGLRTYGYMFSRGLGVEEDHRRAFELSLAAAEKGDGYGAFNAVMIQLRAEKKTITHAECIRLLTQAAEGGNVEAGALLADRLSAEDRDEEALKWYVWAAERGHDGATNAAADWYRDGLGTAPDDTQAMRWLLTLAAKLNLDAVHKAHTIGARMTDDQIREAGRLANLPDQAEIMVATVHGARSK